MHTTQIGDIAEMMVAVELVKRGYVVSRPLTNGAPYDLLVDMDGAIKRIQVKSAHYSPTGSITLRLSSSKYHRGRKLVNYDGRVDYVICVERNDSLFFVAQGGDLKKTMIYIRTGETKNGQKKGIRMAESYLLDRHFPSREMVDGAGFEPATPAM